MAPLFKVVHFPIFFFFFVEQDDLMSPNPSGMLEDLVDVVCVSSCLKLVNSLLKLIQAQLNL